MSTPLTPERVRQLAAGAGLHIPDDYLEAVVRQLQLLQSGLDEAPEELLADLEPAYNLPLSAE